MKFYTIIFLYSLFPSMLLAQLGNKELTRKAALQLAQERNPQVQLANTKKEKQMALRGAALSINAPEVIFEAPTSTELRPGVLQTFDFPTTYIRKFQAQKQQIGMAETEKKITLNQLRYQVNTTYNDMQYLREVLLSYQHQDSLLEDVLEVSSVRLQVGQISNLEKLNAQSQYREVQYQLNQIKSKLRTAGVKMSLLTGNLNDTGLYAADNFEKLPLTAYMIQTDGMFSNNPLTLFYEQNKRLQKALLNQNKSYWMPGLVVGYLNQGADNTPTPYRMRYGFTFPLWFWGNISQVKAAKKELKVAEQQAVLNQYELNGNYTQAISELKQYTEALNYYEQTALPQAEDIASTAIEGYRLGSIGYYNYLLNLQQVIKIRLGYLEALKNYNQAIYTIQYLRGE
jgi:outer membrane protein TolC